jgi:Terminase small subunit
MDVSFDDLKLTKRQAAFVKEYVARDFNGTQAVIAAGFSEKGASVTACRLLAHPKIKAALARIKGAVVAKVQEPQAIKSDMSQAVSTAEAIAITAENIMFQLARMGMTEHLRAKFLTETDGHLRYDFSEATPEELRDISAQVDGVTFKSTTRKEPRKDQEPVEITTIESKIVWADRKAILQLMGSYREIMAWKEVVEVKNPDAMTPEQRMDEMRKILDAARKRGGGSLIEGTPVN